MPRESGFWRSIQAKVPGHWRRIESPVTSGLPDCLCLVDGVTSFVELKDKPVLMDRLGCTKIQRHWMRSWCMRGGSAFLLARVGREVFFVDGRDLLDDGATLEEWRDVALVHAPTLREFDWSAVHRYMSRCMAA